MNKLDPALSKACIEITKNLLTINDPTKKQVKEEIITRMSELGCKILSGKLTFNISLLKKSEFLKSNLVKKLSYYCQN